MFGKEKVDEAAGSTRYKRGGGGGQDTEILQNKKKIGIKSIMKVVKEKDRTGDRERKKV